VWGLKGTVEVILMCSYILQIKLGSESLKEPSQGGDEESIKIDESNNQPIKKKKQKQKHG
jgi:hypothetical protein